MARQVGQVLFHGTFFWANGYIGPDGRAVMRLKPPGMTKKELRKGKSELRRIYTAWFGQASHLVMDWWRWVPKELRALADRYASQRMVGMVMPCKRPGLATGVGVLSGMNLSGDAVAGAGYWVDMLGEDRDFYARSSRLPEGFVVRGMEGLETMLPKVKKGKLRVRVHIHVGMAGGPLIWDEEGKVLPQVCHHHVTEWVEPEDVESVSRLRLDWKRILNGRKVGDLMVLLGVEVGHVRGKGIIRLKCASRLWVAWAGALEHVPKRRVNRGRRRLRLKDRAAVRRGQVTGRKRTARGRDGPLESHAAPAS